MELQPTARRYGSPESPQDDARYYGGAPVEGAQVGGNPPATARHARGQGQQQSSMSPPSLQPIEGATLDEEVLFLRRKVQYLQSVGTVFRQKVALLLRECRNDPSSFKAEEFERLYKKAVGEMTRMEGQSGVSSPHQQQRGGSVTAGADGEIHALLRGSGAKPTTTASPDAVNGFATEVLRYQRARASRDDIKRTHHLCTILQEKNEIKQKEINLRKQYDDLRLKYTDLETRFHQQLQLQSTGGGSAAAAAQETLFRKREEELQGQLLDAKTEIQRLKTQDVQPVTYEHAAIGDTGLHKQNILLKAKIQKLKEEHAVALEQHTESAAEQQEHIHVLTELIGNIKNDLKAKDDTAIKMTRERSVMAKEVVQLRSQVELLEARAETVEKEREFHMTDVPIVNEAHQEAQGRELEAASKRIHVLENTIVDLQEQLDAEQALTREKDVKIDSLGAQIQQLRGRIEAISTSQDEKEQQQQALNEFQDKLQGAISDMRNSQMALHVSSQMDAINKKLQRLEGVEMQMRQKEDQLAISLDEAESAKKAMSEMKNALLSISTLYTKFPSSASQLERIIIELEEYKTEVVRCAKEGEVPDAVHVEGVVELRCMDAEAAKPKKDVSDAVAAIEGPPHSTAVGETGGEGRESSSSGRTSGQSDIEELLQDLPPPPALLPFGGATTSLSPSRPSATPKRTAATPGGSGLATDARLTFQLFDEKGVGKLPVDTLRLCLATLGLPSRLMPLQAKEMSAEEFVLLCTA